MDWVSGAAIYLILWWVVIFMVLPWGVRPISDEDVRRGHAASAPRHPHLRLKMAVTTIVAAILWLGVWYALDSGVLNLLQ